MYKRQRLDRNTSGLITAGKSLAGLQKLGELFKERTMKKYYLCLVKGRVCLLYTSNINEGERVKAGELLGFMGDSGYGPEGTTGNFAVHLHVGIYFYENGNEVSVNPCLLYTSFMIIWRL